jgi:hypothetical protein
LEQGTQRFRLACYTLSGRDREIESDGFVTASGAKQR